MAFTDAVKKHLLIFFLLLGITYLNTIQAQPEIKPVQLTDNITLLPIYGVNTTVFKYGKEALVIDAGYEQVSKLLESELEKLGVEKVTYLINTHWHFDHVGGNKFFGDESIIIAHSSVRDLLSKDEMLLGEMQKAYPTEALPEITIDGKVTLYIGDEEVELIRLTGAHTRGDILVWFKKANIVHIGDIVFADIFPFVDVDHGGSVLTLAENLEEIVEMFPADIKLVPGHGRILSIDDIYKYREMVITTTDIVRSEIDAGKTKEEIIAANVLNDWQEWGKAFSCADWIGMIYKSIKE